MTKLILACVAMLVVGGMIFTVSTSRFTMKLPRQPKVKMVIAANGAAVVETGPVQKVQGSPPKAEAADRVYDFGVMDPHAVARHEFVIRNEGAGTLHLTNEGTSCKKCTIAGMSRNEVPPGEDAVVTIEWNSGSGPHYSQSATIGTDDPELRSIQLRVEGRVRMYLGAEPDELVLEGVRPGKSSETETVLYSQTVESPNITEIRASREGFTWEVLPADEATIERLQAVWAKRLVIRTPADLPAGRFEETVFLKIETPGAAKEFTDFDVRVVGRVKRNLAIYGDIDENGVIDVGVVMRSDGRTMKFKAKVNDDLDRTLHLREIQVTPDFVKCTVTPTPGVAADKGLYDLTIEIPAGAPVSNYLRGDGLGQVRIVTDHPRIGEVPLALQFAVREPDE